MRVVWQPPLEPGAVPPKVSLQRMSRINALVQQLKGPRPEAITLFHDGVRVRRVQFAGHAAITDITVSLEPRDVVQGQGRRPNVRGQKDFRVGQRGQEVAAG
jgi:hypothetical protein